MRLANIETVQQIDCNNPAVDFSVVARFESNQNPLELTIPGKFIVASELDNVPFACPLTQDPEAVERKVESFISVCTDCPHSYISLLPFSIS